MLMENENIMEDGVTLKYNIHKALILASWHLDIISASVNHSLNILG